MALTDLFQFISLGVLVLAVSSNFSARLLLEDSAGPAPADPLVGPMPTGPTYHVLSLFYPTYSYLRPYILTITYIDLPQLESKLGPSYAGDSAPHTDRHDPIYDHLFEKPSPVLAQGIWGPCKWNALKHIETLVKSSAMFILRPWFPDVSWHSTHQVPLPMLSFLQDTMDCSQLGLRWLRKKIDELWWVAA